MAVFKNGHAWRAVVLLCGMVWLGSTSPSVAGPAGIPYSRAHLEISDEPFGRYVEPFHSGGLLRKCAHKLEDERVQLALCDGDRERCVSEAALKFLRIVDAGRQRQGRARLSEINRAINLAIRPMEDLEQYGQIDVWSSPLVTFSTGAGDYEDYAIAKYVALQMVGIPAEDLRIVVVIDADGKGHAVTSVRSDGHWLILDNQLTAIAEDVNARNYRARFVIEESGVMEFSDAPRAASAPMRNRLPSRLKYHATRWQDAGVSSFCMTTRQLLFPIQPKSPAKVARIEAYNSENRASIAVSSYQNQQV